MSDSQQKLQALHEQFQRLQQGEIYHMRYLIHRLTLVLVDLQNFVQSRQKLEAQLKENDDVKQVLKLAQSCETQSC